MHRARRILISTVAPLTVLASLSLAAPANAATISVTDANCSVTTTGTPVSGATGDVVTITSGLTGCSSVYVRKALVDQDSSKVTVSGTASVSFSAAAPNQFAWSVGSGQSLTSIQITLGSPQTLSSAIQVTSGSGNPAPTTTWQVIVTAGGAGGDSSSTPAPIVQQFGVPQSITCEAAAPASLNWAGVGNGGWSQSWAQWMNGGKGGAVCTRTLVYSTAAARWVVA